MPLHRDVYGNVAQLMNIARAQAPVAVSGVSAQSAAFQAGTRFVRIVATTDVYLAFGSNPTATSTGILLPAGVVEVFPVNGGEKVAAIQVASSGTMSVCEDA